MLIFLLKREDLILSKSMSAHWTFQVVFKPFAPTRKAPNMLTFRNVQVTIIGKELSKGTFIRNTCSILSSTHHLKKHLLVLLLTCLRQEFIDCS